MSDLTTKELLERRGRELRARIYKLQYDAEEAGRELEAVERALAALADSAERPRIEADKDDASGAHQISSASIFDDSSHPSIAYGLLFPESQTWRSKAPDDWTIREAVYACFGSNREFERHGATTSELAAFMRERWGRIVERSSLAPTLSRMREDGLARNPDGRWRI
jgi:hypothetical protein